MSFTAAEPGRSRQSVRPIALGIFARLSRGAAGAAIAGLGIALIDGSFVQASLETSVPWGSLLLDELGVLVPLVALVGIIASGLGFLFEPGRPRSPAEIVRRWAEGAPVERRRRAALALAVGLVLIPWGTALATVARLGFTSVPVGGEGEPVPAELVRGAGLAITVAALALTLLATLAVLAAASRIERLLERCNPVASRPLVAFGIGAALATLWLAYGIGSGTTGGQGGFFGIWGVLKRPELDLRGAGLLLGAAAGGLLGPALLARLPWFAALAIAAAPLAATVRAAGALNEDPAVLSAVEGAPLGGSALRLLRKATDRDGDGASGWFGGGDCNDHDPHIGPLAIDVPGNGVDEDCSGEDAPLPSEPAPVVKAAHADSASVPADLNLLLVTVDTLRGDLGFAGYPKPVSPHLDGLAARAVVFERGYSMASYTGKSVGPLLIGKYPSETHRGFAHFNSYSRDDTFVAERIRAAGLRTLSVQAHWYFGPSSGMSRGFDVLDMSSMPNPSLQQQTDATVTGDKLTNAALRVLGDPANTSSRFFAWVHYVDPHADYIAHPGAPDFGSGMRAPYDGEVYFTDQQIGRLIDFVSAEPWGKKTAIIVTSDHGEAFGEHHMIRHGVELWEELVRVPYIVFVPGVRPHRISVPRSAIDIVPTILELLHVPPPEGRTPFDFVSGHSLAPDLYLREGEAPAERDVFIDMPQGPYNDERRAFIHEDRKLYVSAGVRYQLFDLAADPAEKHDIYGNAAEVARILPVYRAFKADLREVYVKPTPK